MTDLELATYLGIDQESSLAVRHVIATMPPEKRALYERMREVEDEVRLYELGLGPRPKNVLLDFDRKARTP